MTESFKQYGIKLVILISNAASFFVQILFKRYGITCYTRKMIRVLKVYHSFCMATTTTTKTAFDNTATPESEILNVTNILYLS